MTRFQQIGGVTRVAGRAAYVCPGLDAVRQGTNHRHCAARKGTRTSALDLGAVLNFVNSLLLPLISFLLGVL